jgi:hypothetical protein
LSSNEADEDQASTDMSIFQVTLAILVASEACAIRTSLMKAHWLPQDCTCYILDGFGQGLTTQCASHVSANSLAQLLIQFLEPMANWFAFGGMNMCPSPNHDGRISPQSKMYVYAISSLDLRYLQKLPIPSITQVYKYTVKSYCTRMNVFFDGRFVVVLGIIFKPLL